MKNTPIDQANIKKGDLIRVEFYRPTAVTRAIEYVASFDGDGYEGTTGHFLIPEPFEPHPGMVISHPADPYHMAAYVVDANDLGRWLGCDDDLGSTGEYWFSDNWAKHKIDEGWVIVEQSRDD